MIFKTYDVVVVGGGHAGAEAAAAAARMGCHVLLVTQMLDTICQMSCNPAMGGVAKGQIVREIDALGGWSGIVTDRSTLQFRMLNRSKGPAMWSPRAQCDRMQFSLHWRNILESTQNLDLWQDEVTELITEGNAVKGVRTLMGHRIPASAVILTNGTFLNGHIFIGESHWQGGRISENASLNLSNQLKDIGFEVKKLKTGTPVRVDGRTIDFSKLQEQKGDTNPSKFSFSNTPPVSHQRSCFIANTNLTTHEILRKGFEQSPLFTGKINGRGPRYCPSIEDKICRFADKDHHQLFVEPEGWHSQSYYLNGFSSSLPIEVQLGALHSICGFENARIFKPGYAVEYDYFPPIQLRYTLETKMIENLYFAGQINGTTGYEEAACQGLMAGINAALKLHGKVPFILERSQAYIGVLIDDLITKGVDEPYRMFTSRAEYRILLRQDTADLRLTPLAYGIGLADEERMRRVEQKKLHLNSLIDTINTTHLLPSTDTNTMLSNHCSVPIQQKTALATLLQRPELNLTDLSSCSNSCHTAIENLPDDIRDEVEEEAEIMIKYKHYIDKEQEVASRILKFEQVTLPHDFDYYSLTALSYEAREKLSQHRPTSIGAASRISGVSPADISVLLVNFSGR
ncbi:MAG: tRNA uridine-5-carboxymethylaminomethyl(34) synthesis enzyme MnmG [Bacteroidales bacterium]|nr:tRNA uridine-5-carboxymethylaminomethyl(34) synthesis enzyme MnmG [Bacteroidales bacterium]